MTTHIQGTYCISIETSTSFFKWLTSNNKLRAWKEILVYLLKFHTGWISVEKITVTGMHEAQAATFITGRLYKIWTTKILIFFLWPRNLRAAFAGSFLWASCRTWKTWDLGRATLLITKSCVGGRECVTGQNRNVTQSARLGSRLRKCAGTPS